MSTLNPESYYLRDGSGVIFQPKLQVYKPELILGLTPAQARGVVWIFKQPDATKRYIISGDPSFGIPGWHPGLMTEEDLITDNAAATVWELDKGKLEQVAEYAAPVTPEVFAYTFAALGRLYAGKDPMMMAQAIQESFPGPGGVVEQVLLGQLHYFNYWTPRPLESFDGLGTGLSWRSDLQSNKTISLNAREVVQKKTVIVRSPWLAQEMQDAELDREKWKISIEGDETLHDDRLRSAMIGWWLGLGREINTQMLSTAGVEEKPPQKGPKRDWQNSDCSVGTMEKEWNRRWWEIGHGSR